MKPSFTLLLAVCALSLCAQQVPDTAFQYAIKAPRYAPGMGSVVYIDAAHQNFHTADGRYAPFAAVLRGDGYQVAANEQPFTAAALSRCRVLVISNAIDSTESWSLPAHSAFTAVEIQAVHDWVQRGGRLLLIADHMPFAGAAADLARAFGFEFVNCFAMDNRRRAYERFYKTNGTLSDNELTRGIDTVVTFTGSAFRLPKQATGILTLRNYSLLSTRDAWQFEEDTPVQNGEGYYQGAFRAYGQGRLVVMGEAAMFSAQLAGPNRTRVGMNHPVARENAELLLNIMHWLDGK